ncbi:MAG: hypothetical protein V7L02_26150 [Nostoc sp.]
MIPIVITPHTPVAYTRFFADLTVEQIQASARTPTIQASYA